jgi:long-subunit acyl-CoA synthetase (AMP-forming)/GNAT superfamily N-acetyltransferase
MDSPDLKEIEKIIAVYSHGHTSKESDSLGEMLKRLSGDSFRHQIAAGIDSTVFRNLGESLLAEADTGQISDYLEIFRSSDFLRRISAETQWPDLVLNLLRAAEYSFPVLFYQRADKYQNKVLFSVLESGIIREYTWSEIASRVDRIARGLISMLGESTRDKRVAFFTKNSLEMVLFDLACLTSGIVNLMIPANSVASHVSYILNLTEPEILIVSDISLLNSISAVTDRLPFLTSTILFEAAYPKKDGIYSVDEVIAIGEKGKSVRLDDYRRSVKFNDLATVMFTSGTTGNPKGIQFSHQNIVFKRFARAMALPEIGEDDIFLAYLPLFHTFGRWLEMTGCIYWGAHYVFMENPAPEIMIENMQRIKPSVFISIPKKWYQLYDAVGKEVNVLKASNEEIRTVVHKLTGGNLKWGLSAAGHLDAEIFQFFQQNGVELLSGFGMTEATGGITMTPPAKYKPGSLGKALPGIELKMAEDGELLIKGPYVMIGYINPEASDENLENGWLPTGDIMQMDDEGFIQIIDRKKEIYKNIRGETIAPQKIENFFRDFDFIKHVFLVGDHRPFNTLLIYPDYNYKAIDFKSMTEDELRSYFNSIIVSVNQFLSPYERIIDFTFIDRDFDPDKGELTPKSTYRRKTVEENYKKFIQPMYDRHYYPLMAAGFEIRIPNWFLKEKGMTNHEIRIEKNRLYLNRGSESLTIEFQKNRVRIGDTSYTFKGKILEMGKILSNPFLWIGNAEVVVFAGEKIFKWIHKEEHEETIIYRQLVSPVNTDLDVERIWQDFRHEAEIDLSGLHAAAVLLQRADVYNSDRVFEYLGRALKEKDVELQRLGREILRRTIDIPVLDSKRRAFVLLLNAPSKPDSESINKNFLDLSVDFINKKLIEEVCRSGIKDKKLEILFKITREYSKKNNKRCVKLFRLLSRYAATHPTRYKIIRQFLVSCQLENYEPHIRRAAQVARFECRDGFREWLGISQEVAVDIETNKEYQWEDVIIFEESIDPRDRQRLLLAVKNTTLIREAIFLFSRGILVRLNDIPPGGVWVSLLGEEHGKSVYRVTVQTRYQGSFDIAVNVNHEISFENILDEINWLIQSSTSAGDVKLVEDFGGYWDEYDLWSEEFIQGETAGRFIRRMIRQQDPLMDERLSQVWPYFIWSGVSAYTQFWRRTRERLELEDPTPTNIIIPKHDYQTGSRIVSISARRRHLNVLDMLKNFISSYIEKTELEYEKLKGIGKNKFVFSGIIEALGRKPGLAFLSECLLLLKDTESEITLTEDLKEYLTSVQKGGYIPKTLYFAIKRYHRWRELNNTATSLARAATLTELYNTYQLNLLEVEYPETRTRFFRDTVFAHANQLLRDDLEKIICEQQEDRISEERFAQHISNLQKTIELNEEELFFLARLGYPHLQPDDSADLISLESGGVSRTDLVLKSKDWEGGSLFIRAPVNPKEIARLHQLFMINNLSVQFKPEHMYLIAVNERNQLIGGLFYKKSGEETVHIEKIVVADFYRKKGISDGLLNEFFNRMKNEHIFYVTTGFFRPEYFYRFGFKIERKYAGLVKNLFESEQEKGSI